MFIELFVVLAFVLGWLVLECVASRLDKRGDETKKGDETQKSDRADLTGEGSLAARTETRHAEGEHRPH